MTFTPAFSLGVDMRLTQDLFFFAGLLQQYGNMYFGYSGDKTTADYKSLEECVKSLYSGSEDVPFLNRQKTDTSRMATVKGLIVSLDERFGDHVWPATVPHESMAQGFIISKTNIDGIQLLADLNLKVKYFKQHVAQLMTLNTETQAADFTATLDLCRSLFTFPYGSVDPTTANQKSGIKQIMYVLDGLLGHGYFPSNTQ